MADWFGRRCERRVIGYGRWMAAESEPSGVSVHRDSFALLIEAMALAVLIAATVVWAVQVEDWWIIPFVVFGMCAAAGLVHLLGMYSSVELTSAGVSVRRRIRPAFMPWDIVRACDYDYRQRRYAVYRRVSGEPGQWVALTRGAARVMTTVLQRAAIERAPLDPQIRLPGRTLGAFDHAEFAECLRSAERDAAAEAEQPGSDQLVQSLVIDRGNASVDRDDNSLPMLWPMWIGALVLAGAVVLSLLSALYGLDTTLFPIALFAWGFVTATYKLVTPITIAYLAVGLLAAAYSALALAAIMDIDEARITFFVITGIVAILAWFAMAAYGAFDEW